MTFELTTMLVGLTASFGFAIRSHFAARAEAETTHGKTVDALIERAERAEARLAAEEADHGETAAKLVASEERGRRLAAELSAQMQGTRVARPEEKR